MPQATTKNKQVRRIILIEGLVNLFVLICKLSIGLTTGSMAILADAFHSLTDIANNIIAWFVIYLSSQPADREHPYGHKKFETIAVFILASLLVVIAFEIAINAIRKEHPGVASGGFELVVMLSVLAINVALSSWQRMWANRLESDILRADATHTFADALTTIVVIFGWQISAMGYVWVDQLCAITVAVLIAYLAFGLFKRCFPILVDGFAIEPEKIKHYVKQINGINNVYRARSRRIGNTCSIDLVISVDPDLPTRKSHAIADEVESLLKEQFQATDISVHVEPDNRSHGID